jgi:peptidoglycan/LPS O-acetylase OafA/YrhL
MSAPRLPELDALRGVAIAAVVGLHVRFPYVLAAPPGPATTAALAPHLLVGPGTPLFVALSMAGLALGYPRPMGFGGEYGAFLARRARRILPAYVFWTALTLLRDDSWAFGHPLTLAHHLATGSASFHLYFVPLIFEYYLLWPLFSPLAAAARRSMAAATVVAALGLAATLLVWRAASAGLIGNGTLMLPLFWLGYATLGIAAAPVVARGLALRARSPLPWIVGAGFVVTALVLVRHVQALIDASPDRVTRTIVVTIFQARMLPYTLAAMALATILVAGRSHGTRLLQALGRASYGIYLSHVLVLGVVLRRMLGRPTEADFASPLWMLTMLVTWAACLAAAYALVRAMERVPGLRTFAGGRTDAAERADAPVTR